MCTDGVFEVHNALREELGQEGFLSILERLDYPRKQLEMDQLEAELLKYSNNIRLQDDLTMTLLEYGA
jgi:serine phosphatase RsbU (regulator of sigma subunit)